MSALDGYITAKAMIDGKEVTYHFKPWPIMDDIQLEFKGISKPEWFYPRKRKGHEKPDILFADCPC